ncbi:DUF2267 domain-containing protein [Streptomyces sp. NBC_01317]|uniref:DUF2267 domain-containing protein n=1 Tax=Streptomyces sp. NBC_01317 TaxID=2903822 RepID=UPI002E0E1808|nr:DUF2267 domain-containing protein [Streptomyces sp. NBC_01317]
MTRRESTQRAPMTTYGQLLEKVRYDGVYPTRRRAEEALRAVLPVLGRQLTDEGRAVLAGCLPVEASELLAAEASAPAMEPLTDRDFVEDVAHRTGSAYAVACWDTETVLTNLAALTGPVLLPRLLVQLPASYAPLFGRTPHAQAA